MSAEPLVLVHGGAGSVPAASQAAHREGCKEAARAGGAVLESGGNAVEAACAAVEVMENNPVYNAGLGCALTRDGGVSLDTAIMCGATLDAAGLAVLAPFANPVRIAQALLPEKEVLLAGEDASLWAESHGFERLDAEALITPASREQWHKVVHEGASANFAGGTVGAVVRSAEGRLAAATSTGGTMGKTPGRVGDSPLIGVGTYANSYCAISATGEGESFMRAAFASRVAQLVRAGGLPDHVLEEILVLVNLRYGGEGGAILVTPESGPHAFCTTPGMSHGWWSPSGQGCAV